MDGGFMGRGLLRVVRGDAGASQRPAGKATSHGMARQRTVLLGG